MPILITDYKWSETEERVYITVPLKGTKASSAQLFCSNEIIKVSRFICLIANLSNMNNFYGLIGSRCSVILEMCQRAHEQNVLQFKNRLSG